MTDGRAERAADDAAPSSDPRSLVERALAPVDAAALAAFRIAFGLLVACGALRFIANGWVEALFIAPRFHFKYWGFEWIRAWPAWAMHLHVGLVAALGVLVAIGLFYRVAIVLLFMAFTYLELIDVSTYLNHYYLVSLLALLLCTLPANALWSVDSARKPQLRRTRVPALSLWILRLQVGVVYFFAGLAKLGPDWLEGAQPLNIWLRARADFPWIGELFRHPSAAYVMSWTGFLFDISIPLWLSIAKTRAYAYLAVFGFHALTGSLFPIGMFPIIMVTSALVFFPPDWPRRFLRAVACGLPIALRFASPPTRANVGMVPVTVNRFGKATVAAACAYAVIQFAVPLRHRLYGGDVLWHEQGMRWSWKVMVREKNGAVTFVVRVPSTGRNFHVMPRKYLTNAQEREMSGQPDLILQLAHRIRDDFHASGHADAEVYADALASLNGRPAARLIDPAVDLGRVADGLSVADWILPRPTTPAPLLSPGHGSSPGPAAAFLPVSAGSSG
jgi:vitamin K-dependent gamma-carboxylase